jgi:hypothetical protein
MKTINGEQKIYCAEMNVMLMVIQNTATELESYIKQVKNEAATLSTKLHIAIGSNSDAPFEVDRVNLLLAKLQSGSMDILSETPLELMQNLPAINKQLKFNFQENECKSIE